MRRKIEEVYREVQNAAFLGLVVNFGLAVAKLLGGWLGDSFALLADGANSLGDVVSTVVILLALRVAQLPADAEHPYGHSRAEGIAASNVALLIILSAFGIGWEAIQRFGAEHSAPPLWTLYIAGANVVIKECLYQYKYYVGKKTGSASIIANAWDHRSDALCALAVLVGLGAVRFGGDSVHWADEVASMVVVCAIIWSGANLFRKSGSELMDVQADPESVDAIRSTASQVDGVCAVEKLWVRKSGLEYFVDIHIQVPADMSVELGHRVGHTVKDRLLDEFSGVRDVLVHLEPYPSK